MVGAPRFELGKIRGKSPELYLISFTPILKVVPSEGIQPSASDYETEVLALHQPGKNGACTEIRTQKTSG